MSDHDARVKELNERAQREYGQRLADANKRTEAFYETVTQREWILIQRQLDASREQIGGDQGLTLLGMAWISEKRERGGAAWDRLLDMTDAELLAETGYPTEPEPITEAPSPDVPGMPAQGEGSQASESPVTGS